jgi:hypothetical protein
VRLRCPVTARAVRITAELWQHRPPLPPPAEPPPFPACCLPARLQDTTNNPIYTGESAGLSLEDERMQVPALPSCCAAWQLSWCSILCPCPAPAAQPSPAAVAGFH